MAGVRLVVIYPRPADIDKFERDYNEQHLPMAAQKIPGKTKFVTAKVLGTASGDPAPFHRIAEVHFPSMQALQEAAGTQGAQAAIAHAKAISTGGPPIFLVMDEAAPVSF